jgi:hypothetical protein
MEHFDRVKNDFYRDPATATRIPFYISAGCIREKLNLRFRCWFLNGQMGIALQSFRAERRKMNMNRLAAWILPMLFLITLPGFAGAQGVMTVIPQGSVAVTDQTGQVTELKSAFPLKQGYTMVPDGGPCTVRGADFSFKADVKTRFAMAKEGRKLNVSLYSGKVHYVLKKDSLVEFTHPGVTKTVYEVRQITPGPDGNVTGYATVQGDKLAFVNTGGQLTLVPLIEGMETAPLPVSPAAAGAMTGTDAAIVGGAVAAVGAGIGAGISSHKGAASPQ